MGYTSENAKNELAKSLAKPAKKAAKKIAKLSGEYDKRAKSGNVPTGKGMKKKMIKSAINK